MAGLPKVEITYCTQCRWLLRAAWTAQELLTTFESELGGVLAFLDVLLGRAALIVEGDDALGRTAQVGDDEADPWV